MKVYIDQPNDEPKQVTIKDNKNRKIQTGRSNFYREMKHNHPKPLPCFTHTYVEVGLRVKRDDLENDMENKTLKIESVTRVSILEQFTKDL